MKLLFTTLFVLACCTISTAQVAVLADTSIYEVAEERPYPLLKSCQVASHLGWTKDSVQRCSEIQLLSLLSSNMRYPAEARDQNIQGTVVLTFVVEPSSGRVTNIGLLKDIGGGCGQEAIRVLKALDEAGLRWSPGMRGGQSIRVRHSIPLRFKLQEALPYYLTENGDTLYTDLDTDPIFKTGVDALIQYVYNRLQYPKIWKDSCKTGVIEMSLVVQPNGQTQVENLLDFNNLGLDFQWEAMQLANRMNGMWEAATYQGKYVAATTPLRVVFKSDALVCATANVLFDRAMLLADEGSRLLADGKAESAIEKWTEALTLQPINCELLYYRGTTLLNLGRREAACEDYNRIKSIMGVTWFEDIRRLVCGW
jgi:TonB family protein